MFPTLALAGLLAGTASAVPDDFELELDGYYRTRGHVFGNLFADQDGTATLMTQRLRLQPTLNYRDLAKFTMMVDALDDVAWGDNDSLAATSLFAGDPTNTGYYAQYDGQERSTFNMKRAWMEFRLPVGVMRVGRQASNWGMGLLANDGNGFDDLFGENHYGATYDRIMFATKPASIYSAIAKKEDRGTPLYLVFGVDRLVEDPLNQYYGYTCESDLTDGVDDEYDARCDDDGDGITDMDHSYVDDERDSSVRQQDWFADKDDDVYEFVYALIYRGEGVRMFGSNGDLTAGTYVVNRKQAETNSNVLIPDAYVKFLWKGIYLESEVLHIRGKSSAIALPGAYDPYGDLANPLYKDVNIWGYVAKAGFKQGLYDVIFETGSASGDDYVADVDFTGRPLHPDYNVGLLLYEEILARVSKETWTDSADGLWSRGGVYNSRYIYPHAIYRPMENWELVAAYLMAWPNQPDGSRILCADYDEVECSEYKATALELGWEIDFAVKHTFHNHINFSSEFAYAKVSDRVNLEGGGLDPDGKFWTWQTRFAYEF